MSKYTDIRRQAVFKTSGGGVTTLTVGTTPIVGGTVGRIFFQGAGDVLAQSSNLFWDNTSGKLYLGGGTTPSSAILVQSSTANSDALSLSLSFKRTNSANSNTTWSAVRAYNSADTLVGLFGTFQESAGGGSRFTVSTSTNTGSTAVTERFRVASDGKTSLGQSILGGAALDVHSLGALSTDLAFRVRNSANTFDLVSINGVGLISGRTDGAGGFSMNYQGVSANAIQLNFQNGNATLRVSQNTGGHAFNVYASTDNREYLAGLVGKATFAIGANPLGGTIKPNEANTNTMYVFNGTAPTLSATDSFNLYARDIVAGNAAPHFRTEAGDVIKLYKNAAVTTPQGIADVLTNLGVLTASTIAPSVQSVTSAATVTPVNGNDLVTITAQAVGLTLANPTGTWPEGKDLMIRIKDNGTPRSIGYDTNYRAIGVTLPTTTVANKTTYLGIIYNSTDTKWDVIGVTTEA